MAAVLCLLVTSARFTVASAVVRPDSVQLAEIEKSFGTPRGPQRPTDIKPIWFDAWKLVLHNQIDGLFSAIAQRPDNSTETGAHSEPSLNTWKEGEREFKIAIVGDSTMRMQTKALARLMMQREELTCGRNPLDLRCHAKKNNTGDGTLSSEIPGISISVKYVKTIESCQGESVEADFVYFGCGLRLLQLIPDREESAAALDTWVNYERLLEEAVLYYRSGGGSGGRRVPVGEAFMTTHSFADEVLDGEYETRVREYEDEEESLLAKCRKKVEDKKPVHGEWESQYKPEDICTHGTFDAAGVLDLNRRAEPVMARLGVPMVRGYDITRGQLWATLPEDGRHYPAMIPVELNSFLSEVTTALRVERRAFSASGAD